MKNKPIPPPATADAPPAAEPPPAVFRLTLSSPLIIVFILLMALPWLALIWLCVRENDPVIRPPAISVHREGVGAIKPAAARVVQGPWGTLKIEPIIVEPPTSFFNYDYDAGASRSWIIAHATPDQARSLLARSGLDSPAIETLLQTATPDAAKTGQILRPPDELVRQLAPGVRAALYCELGRNPSNIFQANPFKFRGATAPEWFASSGLPEEIVRNLEPLIYRRQQTLCFSDLHLVLPEISPPLERIRLLQTLHRAATFSLHLVIKPGDSLDALLAYWGGGGRRDDIEPILASMHKQAGGDELDVSYLLPDFARTRLYTYINPTRGDPSVRRDCHWTSFNFFNTIPNDRYGKLTDLTTVTREEYEIINSPLEFGDLIFFIIPPNSAIHSCVYIAGDLVFTKDGIGFGQPFIFERLDDVVAGFREDAGDFKLQYCRRRERKD